MPKHAAAHKHLQAPVKPAFAATSPAVPIVLLMYSGNVSAKLVGYSCESRTVSTSPNPAASH
jgi:hypothetical protein